MFNFFKTFFSNTCIIPTIKEADIANATAFVLNSFVRSELKLAFNFVSK